MPTVLEVTTAAANFVLDAATADEKINGTPGLVVDRHGASSKNLNLILAELEGMGASLFDSEAIGLANTNDGDLFQVVGTGAVFSRLYKNVSGSAVYQNLDLPSSEAFDAAALKVAYENLPDTNAFTDALKETLEDLDALNSAHLLNAINLTSEASEETNSAGLTTNYSAVDPYAETTTNIDNFVYFFRPPTANAAAPTLTVTSSDVGNTVRSACPIVTRVGSALQVGDLLPGSLYSLKFNPVSLAFELLTETERARNQIEVLGQTKRDLTNFDDLANEDKPGFMSASQVQDLAFATAQLKNFNAAPSDITLSNTSFSVSQATAGTVVMEAFVTDISEGDSWVWSFAPTGGPDNDKFVIDESSPLVDGRMYLSPSETLIGGQDYTIALRVLDAAGGFIDRSFVVSCRAVDVSVHALTDQYVARLDFTPTATELAGLDRFITNALVPLHVAGKHVQAWYDRTQDSTSGLVNIFEAKYNNWPDSGMSHVNQVGWQSDGIKAGLRSGWIPELDPNGFLMRSAASFGSVLADVVGGAAAFGCSNALPWEGASNRFWYVAPRNFDDEAIAAIGHTADGRLGVAAGVQAASASARGLWGINREGLNGPSTLYKAEPNNSVWTALHSNTLPVTNPPASEFCWCRAGDGILVDQHLMNFGLILRDTATVAEMETLALEFKLLEDVFEGSSGTLVIEDSYDQATVYGATSFVEEATSQQPRVILRGRPDQAIPGGGGWWHARARLVNVQNKNPEIHFRNREPNYPRAHIDVSRPQVGDWVDTGWYSDDDRATWKRLGRPSIEFEDVNNGKTTVFQHDQPFSVNTIYFAPRPDFPTSKWEGILDGYVNNSLVHETAQSLTPSNTDHTKYSIANTDAFVSPIGRSVSSYSVPMFEIRDDTASNPDSSPKRIVLLTSGMHPGESSHSWNLKGFLDWVLGGSSSAVEYLERFRTVVLPNTHPHALASGFARVEPLNRYPGSTTVFKDSNSGWLDGDLNNTAAKIKPKLLAHLMSLGTAGRISVAGDFHEFGSGSANFYWNSESFPQSAADDYSELLEESLVETGSPFAGNLRAIPRGTNYLRRPSSAEKALFIDEPTDATWAFTPEQGPDLVTETAHMEQFGEAIGRSFIKMYQQGLLPDRTAS